MSAQSRTPTSSNLPQTLAAVPTGLLQRKCACGTHTVAGGECASCGKAKASLNHQRAATNAEPVNEVPPIVHEVLLSPGQPLKPATRALMESRFGHNFSHVQVSASAPDRTQTKLTIGQAGDQYEREADAMAERMAYAPTPKLGRGYNFGDVRIHTGPKAADSARAVDAVAYTVGRDIVFGAGQYAPDTARGRQVLAHELTHVAQQGGGRAEGKGVARLQRLSFSDVLEEGASALLGAGAGQVVRLYRQVIDDLVASVKESPQHVGEFLKDEVWEAIKDHWVRIVLVTAGLIVGEMAVAALTAAPEPTMITKVIAFILQIAIIAIIGYFAAVEVKEAYEEGKKWFSTAKNADGDPTEITEASRSFVRMVWHILMAVLAVAGLRARVRGLTGPKGTAAASGAEAGGGAGVAKGGGEVIPISRHPGFKPKVETPALSQTTGQPSGYYGRGGAAPKLEPFPSPIPEAVPQAPPVPAPVRATAPSSATGPGVQVGPAVAAGVSAATSEEKKEKEILHRAPDNRESVTRLARMAEEAEKPLGLHGVSAFIVPMPRPHSKAPREEVEKFFPVRNTAGPTHRTIVLPKPVTTADAAKFNAVFGRK